MSIEYLAGNRIRGLSSERTISTGFNPDISDAWDLSTAVHVHDFTVSGEGAQASGLYFKSDGTTFYVVGSIRDKVTEYNMSTAWDVSTAVVGNNFSLATQGIQPSGIWFKSDGLKFITSDFNSDTIQSYTMSTAWNVTTASVNAGEAFDISADSANPYGVNLSPDGTKMFVIDQFTDDLFQYTLSTPYNPSTAGSKVTVDISSWNTNAFGLFIDDSGKRLYTGSNEAIELDQTKLTTAFDISTLVTLNNLSSQNGRVDAVFLRPDGLKMYTVEGMAVVSEYNLGTDNGIGAVFYETDTNKSYISHNGTWSEL
tara:strand:+ start:598 stop:1533 length:936 start_codon:yes stop_codon:yes gene_type:complete